MSGLNPTGSSGQDITTADRLSAFNSSFQMMTKRFDELYDRADKFLKETPNSAESSAKLTGVEMLEDMMAYRNAVNAALRDNALSETHDLPGYRMYELKFGVTFIPPERNDLYAQVTLSPRNWQFNGFDCREREYIAYHIKQRVNKNQDSLIHAFNMPIPVHPVTPDAIVQNVVVRSSDSKSGETGRDSDSVALSSSPGHIPNGEMVERSEPDTAKYAKSARVSVARQRYDDHAFLQEQRERICLPQFGIKCTPIPWKFKNTIAPTQHDVTIDDTDSQFNDEIRGLFEKRGMKTRPRVTRVEPAIYAQNLSDVASRQSMLAMVADLAGVLGGGLKAGLVSEAIDAERHNLEAIRRRPLAMGFNNSADAKGAFGWVLGPRFEIDEGKVTFSHTPVHHTLTASVIVPAWQETLEFEVQQQWFNKKGEIVDSSSGRANKRIKVKLNPDYSAVVDLLVDGNEGAFHRRPVIYFKKALLYINGAGKNQTLFIPGENLWDNPQVFVDGDRATEVTVAPSMEGIHARFENGLPSLNPTANNATLTVSTHTGNVILPEALTVYWPASGGGSKPSSPQKPPQSIAPIVQHSQKVNVNVQQGIGSNQTGHFGHSNLKAMEKIPNQQRQQPGQTGQQQPGQTGQQQPGQTGQQQPGQTGQQQPKSTEPQGRGNTGIPSEGLAIQPPISELLNDINNKLEQWYESQNSTAKGLGKQ